MNLIRAIPKKLDEIFRLFTLVFLEYDLIFGMGAQKQFSEHSW